MVVTHISFDKNRIILDRITYVDRNSELICQYDMPNCVLDALPLAFGWQCQLTNRCIPKYFFGSKNV